MDATDFSMQCALQRRYDGELFIGPKPNSVCDSLLKFVSEHYGNPRDNPSLLVQQAVTETNVEDVYGRLSRTLRNIGFMPLKWFHYLYVGSKIHEIFNLYSGIDFCVGVAAQTSMICPDVRDIWRWADLTVPEDVRVIIMGQDPYSMYTRMSKSVQSQKIPMADGLAYSVSNLFRSCKFSNTGDVVISVPRTLITLQRAMYKASTCVKTHSIPAYHEQARYRYETDLSYLSTQGVLLINQAMTTNCRYDSCGINIHNTFGWNHVVRDVLLKLNERSPRRLVYLLWGFEAGNVKHQLNIKKHMVIMSKGVKDSILFDGDQFVQTNRFLMLQNTAPINWLKPVYM